MDVPTPYLINDTRKLEFFKKTTFSNYLKKDVLKTLFQKIDDGQVSEVCRWLCECIVSGYIEELWDKIIDYYTKYININSPLLPYHFYRKLVIFLKLYQNEHFKKHPVDLRNSQEIRNHWCEIMCILTNSTKSRKSLSIPKINQTDFQSAYFQKKLKAPNSNFSYNLIEKKDPPEMAVVINEFSYYLQKNNYRDREAMYWLAWSLEWEKLMILKIGRYECASRNLQGGIDKKHATDFIWLFWFVILREMSGRCTPMVANQIKSLYEFFKFKFTPSKKKRRLFLIYNAILLLDPKLDITPQKYPIFEKYYLIVQACANINTLFLTIKKEENLSNDYVNSKIKQEVGMVITKHEDVSQLNSLSEYRQKLKEKKQREKEHQQYLQKKSQRHKKNKEERENLKTSILTQIDNHIINTSHLRPIVTTSSNVIEKIEQTKQKSKNYSQTLSMMEKIDKKLKIKDNDTVIKNKKKETNGLFTVIKKD